MRWSSIESGGRVMSVSRRWFGRGLPVRSVTPVLPHTAAAARRLDAAALDSPARFDLEEERNVLRDSRTSFVCPPPIAYRLPPTTTMPTNPSFMSCEHPRRALPGGMLALWSFLMLVPSLVAAAPDQKGEQIYRQKSPHATGHRAKGPTSIIPVP